MQRFDAAGSSASRWWRAQRLVIALAIVITVSGVAPVAFGPFSPPEAGAVALGGGTYRVTGTVFGTRGDGLIGGTTSSGRVLQGNDRLAALPSCTESSCPWLDLGTGPEEEWGPQTTCAEADGLCWIEVVSLTTGVCTIAPVLDVGPLFIKDNWWDTRAERTYPLTQGLPAAEVTVDGVDLGFGPGISDKGYDIANVYDYAAAVDLGAGTWADLQLDPGRLVTELEVTLLWQAGTTHEAACGGTPANAPTTPDPVTPQPVTPVPVTPDPVTPDVEERETPAPTVPAPMPPPVAPEDEPAAPITPVPTVPTPDIALPPPPVTPVVDVLAPATGESNAATLDLVYVRTDPAVDAPIIGLLPANSRVLITGGGIAGYFPVTIDAQTGWVFGDFLAPDGGQAGTVIATAMDDINLRAAAAWDAPVLSVVPAGSMVLPTGRPENGFIPAQFGELGGWLPTAYIAYGDAADVPWSNTATAVTAQPTNLWMGPDFSTEALAVVPAGSVIELIGDSENGYLRASYDGQHGWVTAFCLEGYPTAVVSSDLQLRGSPSLDGAELAVMPTNAIVVLTGEEANGYVSVSYMGIGGWAYAGYLQ
ncbi:MAG TPA: hypothetical protein VGR16_05275 [Thermomicrobiales bacterium]|nr:hypothetical protein [Thermomicrobiales bacterium]